MYTEVFVNKTAIQKKILLRLMPQTEQFWWKEELEKNKHANGNNK